MGSSLQQTELSSGPCGDREGWAGAGRREVQEGRGLCLHTAGSLCGAAENNTTR